MNHERTKIKYPVRLYKWKHGLSVIDANDEPVCDVPKIYANRIVAVLNACQNMTIKDLKRGEIL